MPGEQSRLVYSTDGEHVVQAKTERPTKPVPARNARASGRPAPPVPDDGYVRIRREKSGRGGKTVTTVTGVRASERELDDLLKTLKQLCGAGGTREGATLEIQGDHRDRIHEKLVALGHRVKLAGG
jgi:translation initiation factor 1